MSFLRIEYDVKLVTRTGAMVRCQGGSFDVPHGDGFDGILKGIHIVSEAAKRDMKAKREEDGGCLAVTSHAEKGIKE